MKKELGNLTVNDIVKICQKHSKCCECPLGLIRSRSVIVCGLHDLEDEDVSLSEEIEVEE